LILARLHRVTPRQDKRSRPGMASVVMAGSLRIGREKPDRETQRQVTMHVVWDMLYRRPRSEKRTAN